MAAPVRLKLAQREFFSGGGFSGSFAPVSAKVMDPGLVADVAVHYTPDGVNWKDFGLAPIKTFGDYRLFRGTVNEQVEQFVIRSSANGETSYDNNFGQNYRLDVRLADVGGSVVLNRATARQGTEAGGGFTVTTSWLEGEILVDNLSFVKNVGVRISVDGGFRWDDRDGSFAGNTTADGVFIGPAEVWKFKTPEFNLDLASPVFRFAVYYRNGATGQTFWDNNFGQDYEVNKADGATIE